MTRIVRNATLPVSRWPNGAGRKADVAAGPGWMVSFAWLDGDAPFSDYEGDDRTITLVAGPGFTLDFDGHPALSVATPFTPAPFDGGWPAMCRVAGSCRVLNAMTRRDQATHAVSVVAGPLHLLPAATSLQFAVLLRGSATVAGSLLAVLDAVQAEAPVTIEADPTALLAHIRIMLR